MAEDDVETRLDELLKPSPLSVSGVGTAELKKMVEATVILIKSLRKLDKTSTYLAAGNIAVGVVLAVLAVIQIVLMLRGH